MISDFMTRQHRDCDEDLARAEAAAGDGDADGTRSAWAAFDAALERHLAAEENVLFPEFEQRTGMRGGPTAVMRMEHQQMRALVAEARNALDAGSLEQFLGAAETLMILAQQHNMKEEQMLYPMCDRALGEGAAAVIGRIEGG